MLLHIPIASDMVKRTRTVGMRQGKESTNHVSSLLDIWLKKFTHKDMA